MQGCPSFVRLGVAKKQGHAALLVRIYRCARRAQRRRCHGRRSRCRRHAWGAFHSSSPVAGSPAVPPISGGCGAVVSLSPAQRLCGPLERMAVCASLSARSAAPLTRWRLKAALSQSFGAHCARGARGPRVRARPPPLRSRWHPLKRRWRHGRLPPLLPLRACACNRQASLRLSRGRLGVCQCRPLCVGRLPRRRCTLSSRLAPRRRRTATCCSQRLLVSALRTARFGCRRQLGTPGTASWRPLTAAVQFCCKEMIALWWAALLAAGSAKR